MMHPRTIRSYSDALDLTQAMASVLYPGHGRAWLKQVAESCGLKDVNLDDVTLSQLYMMQLVLYGQLAELLNQTERLF